MPTFTPLTSTAPGSAASQALGWSTSPAGATVPNSGWVPTTQSGAPAVMSTEAGHQALAPVVAQHTTDVAAVTPAPAPANGAAPATTPKPDPVTDAAMKSAGGITAQESQASGADLSQYTYDPSSSYYFPTGGTSGQQAQFQSDSSSITSAFQGQNAAMNAATQASVAALMATYASRIGLQTQINNSIQAKVSNNNLVSGMSRYMPGYATSILSDEENAGLTKIADIQNEMTSKINDAETSLQNKEYTSFLDQRKEVNDLKTQYQATLKDLQTKADTAYAAQQKVIQQNKSDVASVAEEAQKNGASPATIAAINAATDKASAITAAGNSLQTSSDPTISRYLFYKNQAATNGQTPESFDTWKAADDAQTAKEKESEAYGTAFATASGKAAGERSAAGTTPTSPVVASTGVASGLTFNAPADIAPYVNFSSNGVKYVDLSGFKGTPTEAAQAVNDAQAAGYKVITNKNTALDVQNITDANAKLADMKTAFDAENAGNAAERDSYNGALMWAAKALQTNPDAAGTDVYQDAALDILKAMSGVQGFRGGASIVDQVKSTFPQNTDTQVLVDSKLANISKFLGDRETALVGTPSASDQILIQGAQSKSDVNSYVSENPADGDNIAKMYEIPGATDQTVAAWLRANGKIK